MKTAPKKPSGHAAAKLAGRTIITISLTPDERQQIRVAAAKAGLSTSAWIRRLALEAAKG